MGCAVVCGGADEAAFVLGRFPGRGGVLDSRGVVIFNYGNAPVGRILHYTLPKSLAAYHGVVESFHTGGPLTSDLLYGKGDAKAMRAALGRDSAARKSLAEVEEYAESPMCKWRVLLSFLGGDAAAVDGCRCGGCRAGADGLQDRTEDAQKILSAAARSGFTADAACIAETLRGRRSAAVLAAGLHRVRTFAAGRNLNSGGWLATVLQMLEYGLIYINVETCAVEITAEGEAVLYGRKRFFAPPPSASLRRFLSIVPCRTPAPVKPGGLTQPDTRLLDSLHRLRHNIAKLQGVAPAMVFPGRTLEAMAAEKPLSLAHFSSIPGVGGFKAGKYGELFMQQITTMV